MERTLPEIGRSHYVWLSFLLFVFSATVFLDVLGLSLIKRLGYISLVLLAMYYATAGRASRHGLIFLFWAFLIFSGQFVNISRGVVFGDAGVSYLGALIFPLLLMLLPFMRRIEVSDMNAIWATFSYGMFIFAIIGILEFYAIQKGLIGVKAVALPGGEFLAGRITIFHALESGEIYNRLYSVFPEPGTLSMYCVVAICYFLSIRKYWPTVPLIIAMAMSVSLGGYASLAIALTLYFVPRLSQRIGWPLTLFAIFLPAAWMLYEGSIFLSDSIAAKGLSFTIRYENFFAGLFALPELFVTRPLGLVLSKNSFSQIEDAAYLGSNFSFFTMFVLGGSLALLGFIVIFSKLVIVSVRNFGEKGLPPVLQAAHLSILASLPFIFQRATPFESVAGVFLWYPLLITPHLYRRLVNPSGYV